MKKYLLTSLAFISIFMCSCKHKSTENQEYKREERKPAIEKQNIESLIFKNHMGFKPDSDKPYSGKVFKLDKKGEVELEGQYEKGKRDGNFKHYIEGVIVEITNYKEGEINGESRKYEDRTYKNFGDLVSIENYKMGLLDGKQIYYNNNKKLIESEYSIGSFTSSQLFDDAETLKTLIYRLSDNEYLIKEYLPNGKIKREKKFTEYSSYEPHLTITNIEGQTIYSISGNLFSN